MAVPLTIVIGNKEYNVIGENENLIREAAGILNNEIYAFSAKNQNSENITAFTTTTIAAMNIIEKMLQNKAEISASNIAFISEINRITDYIETNINNPHYSW